MKKHRSLTELLDQLGLAKCACDQLIQLIVSVFSIKVGIAGSAGTPGSNPFESSWRLFSSLFLTCELSLNEPKNQSTFANFAKVAGVLGLRCR